jgi:hypothetical protein
VIVVTDLASLRGPSRGRVVLPLRLSCSGPSPVFDLGVPYPRRWLYEIVLREASRPEDLTGYLDRDTLVALWPGLAVAVTSILGSNAVKTFGLDKGEMQAIANRIGPSLEEVMTPLAEDEIPPGGRFSSGFREPGAALV